MPLGIERINARTAQPNPNINFIKPQEGADKAYAQDFLERVAAICVPIMKRNHIYVMSLEDFPPNDEFLGRNFNAGEKIQLVLKNKRGGWLPFKFVQRVMMHELAHCKQMNHSKYFWQVNNQHCAELKTLWDQNYTGEGMWSRGLLLSSGDYVHDRPLAEGDMPEHLCGGVFRSNRKRKRGAAEKEKLSYQERQQRRIAKKFGTNGVSLGADDEVKAQLEKGKRNTAKPRVAQSARGRELRAAAALARFEKPQVTSNEHDGLMSDSEDDEDDVKIKPDDAKDINGHRLIDSNGRGMIKVCEDDDDNADARKEMDELRNLDYLYAAPAPKDPKVKPPKSRTNSTFGAGSSMGGVTRTEQTNSYNSQFGVGSSSIGSGSRAEQTKSYDSPYSLPTSNPQTISMNKNRPETENPFEAYSKNAHSESHTFAIPNPGMNRVKQEVFDSISDYLGDSDCNPEGAIYCGLDAAKAAMPKKEYDAGDEVEKEMSAAPTKSSQSQVSSEAVRNPLTSIGTAKRGVKRNSQGFARAVEAHRREETGLGLPPPQVPKIPMASGGYSGRHQLPSVVPQRDANIPSTQPARTTVSQSQQTPVVRPPPPSVFRPPSTQARAPPTASSNVPRPTPTPAAVVAPQAASSKCNVCTTENEIDSLTCMVCSNVLHPERDLFHWRCQSEACIGGEFVNSGDYGLCAVCGEKKTS